MNDETKSNLEILTNARNELAKLLMPRMEELGTLDEKLQDCPAACVALTNVEQLLVVTAIKFTRSVLLMTAIHQEG